MKISEAQECMQKSLEGLVIVPSYKGGIQAVGTITNIDKRRWPGQFGLGRREDMVTVKGSDGSVSTVTLKELSRYVTVATARRG